MKQTKAHAIEVVRPSIYLYGNAKASADEMFDLVPAGGILFAPIFISQALLPGQSRDAHTPRERRARACSNVSS